MYSKAYVPIGTIEGDIVGALVGALVGTNDTIREMGRNKGGRQGRDRREGCGNVSNERKYNLINMTIKQKSRSHTNTLTNHQTTPYVLFEAYL